MGRSMAILAIRWHFVTTQQACRHGKRQGQWELGAWGFRDFRHVPCLPPQRAGIDSGRSPFGRVDRYLSRYSLDTERFAELDVETPWGSMLGEHGAAVLSCRLRPLEACQVHLAPAAPSQATLNSTLVCSAHVSSTRTISRRECRCFVTSGRALYADAILITLQFRITFCRLLSAFLRALLPIFSMESDRVDSCGRGCIV